MDTQKTSDLNTLKKIIEDAGKASADMLEDFMNNQNTDVRRQLDPLNLSPAFFNLGQKMLEDPARLIDHQMAFWKDYGSLLEKSLTALTDTDTDTASRAPLSDRRFKSEKWHSGPFDFFKQFYLLASQHAMDAVTHTSDLDDKEKQKVIFYTRQYLDAMSPTNFALTNPDVLEETLKSGGQNLVNGMQNLLKDMEKHDGIPLISMTDMDAFEVGKNIAASKGKVVFRNKLFELIHYSPTTEEVYTTPLVIFPPWINKFYVLDLTEKKSFVRWAVAKGYTVFMVSWVNPVSEHADMGFDDYVKNGYIEALQVVQEITGQPSAHTIGYCVAGTMLAATLAYLQAKGQEKWVRSATFFTAQIDFEDAGDLGIFIDEDQIAAIDQQMAQKGYLDKKSMAMTFNMLRANDLIWSYAVNNYLLGKDPPAFDLLYWNCDSTNLSRKMHRDYLKEMYHENNLVKPGKITIDGVPIDLSLVKTPTYVQAGIQDHIAPPQSVYKITQHFKGPLTFTLAGSGHIAGVVNPPDSDKPNSGKPDSDKPNSGKYGYWTNELLPETLTEYQAGATEHKGSWWPHWHSWLSKRSGKKTAARLPEKGPYPCLTDAPGTYVMSKGDEKD